MAKYFKHVPLIQHSVVCDKWFMSDEDKDLLKQLIEESSAICDVEYHVTREELIAKLINVKYKMSLILAMLIED